jgi:hypothetical protein
MSMQTPWGVAETKIVRTDGCADLILNVSHDIFTLMVNVFRMDTADGKSHYIGAKHYTAALEIKKRKALRLSDFNATDFIATGNWPPLEDRFIDYAMEMSSRYLERIAANTTVAAMTAMSAMSVMGFNFRLSAARDELIVHLTQVDGLAPGDANALVKAKLDIVYGSVNVVFLGCNVFSMAK